MWAESSEGHKLIKELSKEIVVDVAPEEIDLFDELVAGYFQDPTPPDVSQPQKDDPLGFGIEETLIAVTPAATAVAQMIISYLLTEIIKITESEHAEKVKRKIKALFSSERKDQEPAALTKEQLEHIRKLARKQAIKFGIGPDKADRMADALIGSLALN
jgi:hypothetical protein